MRRDGKIYVDKTAYVHRMASDPNTNLFFISRPRRFGKSLTISVLKALFSGRRELFEGLRIDKTDWKWEKWPIIHLSFNTVSTANLERFESDFSRVVKKSLADAGFQCGRESNCTLDFGDAIEALSAQNGGRGVVILIDEYDAPVGHSLGDIDMAEAIRDRLSELDHAGIMRGQALWKRVFSGVLCVLTVEPQSSPCVLAASREFAWLWTSASAS